MKIKHHDPKIERGKSFANCKLGREPYAEILTQIVSTYPDGMVMAIDNEWGTGKTTFVKMWQQYLEDREFRTVYFNAWENDFDSNALVAILSELKSLTNEGTKEIFKSVMHKGAVLAKNVVPGLVKALTAGMVDLPGIQTALEDTAKGVAEIFEKQVEEHVNKKKTIQEFREVLEKFIKIKEDQKPLVFFVDELDRCRPSYSVEVLEQLKHLFSVPGIVFVLSIDKVQLAHSVRGYYGSDQINADEYLRRFIDLEYSMPRPSNRAFFAYLYQYYEFDAFFAKNVRMNNDKARLEPVEFHQFAEIIIKKSNATLRQLEKIVGHTRLLFSTFEENAFTYPGLLLFLVFLKSLHPDLYAQVKSFPQSADSLSQIFYASVFFQGISNYPKSIHAQLLYSYWKEHYQSASQGTRVDMDDFIFGFIPQNPGTFNKHNLEEEINFIRRDRYDVRALSEFTNRIDLLEPMK